MGCTFTKVRDSRSRDEDEKLSEIISKNSSFTDSKKDLECHTSPATRDIVEKCQQALSVANTTDDDVISLRIDQSSYMDEYTEYTDAQSTEREMDITYYREDSSDLRCDTASNDSSSSTGKSRVSSNLSSRISNFFRKAKPSNLTSQDEMSRDSDTGTGYGYEGDMSSSGWERSPTPTRQDMKESILQNTNSRLSDLSQMVESRRGIHEYQALTLIHEVLEKNQMPELEIEDDGRSSSTTSSEDSMLPSQLNFRVLARPNAARETGTMAPTAPAPDTPEKARNVVEFEAEFQNLLDRHVVATRDYRNRQLLQGGARGPRLPSFSLQFQDVRSDPRSDTTRENGCRYSKYFSNSVTRPQLTVQGLSSTDDRLMQWMVSQQRRDSQRQ
ncbi:uncharacterized protein LOC117326750 [Pecten maximus]|uniref:uncharacterized protein LOC117326750 n=1 Tax=Pecten maximus TaxID=6579 RepID=UPI0014581D00|nr:uncharacterized protein LOC117326750 [Pecten maximus]